MRLISARPGRPTVLALHGRGADENQLLPLLRAADRSCGVLAARGDVTCGLGWVWCRRHGVGVPVPSDLRRRAELFGDELDAALRAHGIGAPVPVVAYSNGAMFAIALAVLRPDLIGPMTLLRGAYPLPWLGRGPVLVGVRIVASAGEMDELLPSGVFAAGVRHLRSLGATVEPCVHRGLGHGLGLADARGLRTWLTGVAGEAAPARAREPISANVASGSGA